MEDHFPVEHPVGTEEVSVPAHDAHTDNPGVLRWSKQVLVCGPAGYLSVDGHVKRREDFGQCLAKGLVLDFYDVKALITVARLIALV